MMLFCYSQTFAALPVTTCTRERSFSALNYRKNYRRSTMTEDRLNGLALMFVYREMSAKPMDEGKIIDNVINRFC